MEEDSGDKVLFHSFLRYYDLGRYYEGFIKMGVLKASHLKDTSDADLTEIGLSGPERTRLRKKAEKHFSTSGKLKNKLFGKDKFASLDKQAAVVAAALAARERERAHQHPSPSLPPRPGVQGGSLESPVLISPESVELREMLGEGAHGAVHEAKYSNVHGSVEVAVKTIITKDRGTSIEAVILEAQSMMQLHHSHIIKFFGIVLGSPLMLVQELAPFGNLRDHLISHPQRIHLGLMHIYSYQIADAMGYLEERKLVHRDLATRNILLLSEGHIKLSDFGLARKIREGCSVYNITNVEVLLPIAWTALEALIHGQFSSASDVWSYGVTLWEIYSLGETPLMGMRPIEVREMLLSGDRLRKPVRCPLRVFHVIQQCWREHPERRPTFKMLYESMKSLPPEVIQMSRPSAIEDGLRLSQGDLVYVIEKLKGELWVGMSPDGTIGYFKQEFALPVDPKLTHALSPVKNIPLEKPVYNKFQVTHPQNNQVTANSSNPSGRPAFNKYMTVIGSPTATGSSWKPTEVEEANAAGVDLNHIGQYNMVQKDLMGFQGVDEGSVSPNSQPNSPTADDNKYVMMKKMKDLEISPDQSDDLYLVMQPSPIHLPRPLQGQPLAAATPYLDFQPSLDESQLPDPIIPSQEVLHSVLYSQDLSGTGHDVENFDPLRRKSSGADISSERSTYRPQPLPRQHKGHHAGYSGDTDSSLGPIGLQLGSEWVENQPELSRYSSQGTTTSSPLSPEQHLDSQFQYSRQPQPLPRQPRSPLSRESVGTSGNIGMSHAAEQLEMLCKEFPDLDSWTCDMALQKHSGDLERAREEVKVKQLMDMGFRYINEDDCRRALSHCQGKMERAAMWLMEQSETIASRT